MERASIAVTAMALAITLAAGAPAAAQAPVDVVRPVARIADPSRSADATFLAKATDAVAADADLVALALTRAKTPAIKAFATTLQQSHAALSRELEAMAGTRKIAGVPPPDAPQDALGALRAQPPAAFDAALVEALVASRTAAVALFEAESRDGRDDEVKDWASRQLPALRDHLTAARALQVRPAS